MKKKRENEKNSNSTESENLPVEKIIPRTTLKTNIESTSLIDVIAMMIVWMPLYNPNSSTRNHSTMSITTFGETAVITKLRIKVDFQFKAIRPKQISRVITELLL